MAALAFFLTVPQAVTAQQRSMDQVMDIVAKSPVGNVIGSARSRMFGGSQTTAGQEPYYIFSSGEGKGFVIVSGDERMAPVLAYSDGGDFDADKVPDNIKAWLSLYEKEYSTLGAKSKTYATPSDGSVVGETESVAPFLNSKWGQGKPYNELCPEYKPGVKAVTGCGATAMAQCMYYYRYPTKGTGSHSYTTETYGLSQSWNYGSHTLQWNLMKNDYTTNGNSDEEVAAIAELLYGCGVAADMDYDVESGSFQRDVMAGMSKYYGYDKDMAIIKRENMAAADWHKALTNELKAKRPMIMSAHTKGNAGHMFVIHGYKVNAGEDPYYYINWGWSGNFDGYFMMPDLCYDGIDANTLSEDISAIVGIQPDNGVQDQQLTIQAKSLVPSTTSVRVHEGESLSVSVTDLWVGNIGNFTGTLRLALIDAADNAYVISTLPDVTLNVGMSYSFTANSTFPGGMTTGTYTLKCYARAEGTSVDVEVTQGSGVTSIYIENDPTAYTPSLVSSEIAVSKSGTRTLSLDATNVMNAAERDFSGTLQMMLTDDANNRILMFGSTKTLSGLGKYSYFPRTDTFTGELPDGLADGVYRLWLGAQQSGYDQWGKVKKYTIEGGYITALDLDGSTRFWLKNNAVSLEPVYAKATFSADGTVVSQKNIVVGDSIKEPEAPEKEGYTFDGWDGTPEVMPANDINIVGNYTINQYVVRFVANDEVVSETRQNYGSAITAPAGPVREGYTFQGWGEVDATVPARDVEYTAQYKANSYHLSFVVDGKVTLEMDTDYGSIILNPKSPSKEGYTFAGWDGYEETMPAHDLVCTALFNINQYTVRFVADGNVVSEQKQDYGSAITAPAGPAKEGYTFQGWGEVDATVPAHDVEYTAQYKINQYVLKYMVDGTEYKKETLDYGTAITAAAAPTKEGYTFSGWGTVPATMPASDVTITGTFSVNKYKVRFVADGTTVSETEQNYGSAITAPAGPAKEGYTFQGWGEVDATVPAHDVEYTAQYKINQYVLKYMVDGTEYKKETLDYGTAITAAAAPTKEGYTFSGWGTVPATMPASDVTITGTFSVNKYKVRFVADGTTVSETEQNYGSAITAPAGPAKEGYTFQGWGEVDATVPAKDVEYEAQYTVNQYILTYILDGRVYKTYTLDFGATISPEGDPEDDDFFYAWEDVPATMPARNVEVNAYVTGIAGFIARNENVQIFSLSGQRLSALQRGINIVRYADGKTRKVVVR